MTTVEAADDHPQRAAAERSPPDLSNTADDIDDRQPYSPCLVASISGEPLDGDVTITSHQDDEEFQTRQVPGSPDPDTGVMQSGRAELDSMTYSRGPSDEKSDSGDGVEECRPAESTVSSDADQKLRCKSVSSDRKLRRSTRMVDGERRSKSTRVCDDCRAGLTKTSVTSREKTQRWNSPASQQSTARNQRITKSAARPSQTSGSDQTTRRNRSDVSKEDHRRCAVAGSQSTTVSQRPVKHRQTTSCDSHPTCSPASTKNRAADSAATSGRRDVTSGHVTRRSLSAKASSTVTEVPGRRCQSTDDRRQRQKNQSVRDQELTQAPFHRKCCCATRNSQGQGHQVTSEGHTGSCSRPSERRALPDAVSKPWARTLRDYGSSEKSPSPVRSRRSTPESANCSRTSTRTTKTGCEVTGKQDLPANRRTVPSSRTKRPTATDLGTTKSDSTLVQRRPDRKIGSTGSVTIPPSTSLGAVTPRRVHNATASRNVTRQRTTTTTATTTTTTTTPIKQQTNKTANANRVSTPSRVPGTPNRRKTTQKESKPLASSTLSTIVSTVDICDLCDLGNSPSRAPVATALQPEVFQRTRTRRRSRLAGNDDVSNASTTPAEQRSRVSTVSDVSDNIGSLSVVNHRVKEVNSSCLTSVTLTTHGDLELDFEPCNIGHYQCNIGHSACDDAEQKLALTASNITNSSSCAQQPEETLNTNITNCTSDGLLRQISGAIIEEEKCLLFSAESFQHPHFSCSPVAVTSSTQENGSTTSAKESLSKTGENAEAEKSSNQLQETIEIICNTPVTHGRKRNSKEKLYSGHDKETERGIKKILSPFDELEIERDFEFMDEILSCTTAELYRFIKPPDQHFSDEPNTQSIDTLFDQLDVCATDYISQFGKGDRLRSESVAYSFCPTSTAEVGPTKSRIAGLLYTVDSVVSDPVIEVAKSLSQEKCLSSPRLSDYVAENRHKVDEVSAEHHHHHHHHHHLAGPGRCQEDLVDCSPCSDEIVLGSSDTSTKCSLSSPSGSQLSQDSCRWRSPDDSTLVGDLEQPVTSASNVTLHQTVSSPTFNASTKSFNSPGASSQARGRPRIPLRRSRHFERTWSPDLSCFRQPRSPDLPDEDFIHFSSPAKNSAEDGVTGPLSRSRLLRRLLFSSRITEAGKLQESSTTDCVTAHRFDESTTDPSGGNGSRTDGNDSDDLLVDVRRYRSLSRRAQEQDSCDVEDPEHYPSTPPLAVFLSSEDITSTIFPLRHATSEPASSRSRAPFNSSPLSARNSPAVGCRNITARSSKRRKERRPLSECFGTTLAMKLTGTLGTLTLTRARLAGSRLLSLA